MTEGAHADPAEVAQLRRELEDARVRLAVSEEAVRAIRAGEVDGVVVASAAGHEQVFTLSGADERRAGVELARSAQHDALTGLPNRTLLIDRIQQALNRRATGKSVLALLFCDVDDFKEINDAYGHQAGDDVLRAVAQRVCSAVRPEDTVARISGDEFVVVCESLAAAGDAVTLASRIGATVAEPITADAGELMVTLSIGVAVLSKKADTTPHTLLRDADDAMYKAKQQGANGIELFDEQLRILAAFRLQLLSDMRQSDFDRQLRLHYQPVVSLEHERTIGVEALIRWQHPLRGLLAPAEFIPLAETTDLISAIGDWTMREACRQGADWTGAESGAPQLQMFVNVSARQLAHGAGLVRSVKLALDESGFDPTALMVEVTETVLMEDSEDALRVVHELDELGVRVAIDDFGVGYSSLVHLKRFPVALLKIDRSFIAGVAQNRHDAAIVRSVIELAHGFGIAAVAEGVETREHLTMLKSLGCTYGQGYFWSPALPAAELAPELFL